MGEKSTVSSESGSTNEAAGMPPIKVTLPFKPAKTITKTRTKKKAPDSNHKAASEKKDTTKKETGGEESPNSDEDELELSEDEEEAADTNPEDTELKEVKIDEVKNPLGRENINDKTLKSYITAYNTFVSKVRMLPTERNRKSDDTIEQYISDQFDSNPKAGNLAKMTHLVCMIKILFPRVYVSITKAKTILKNWNKTKKTAINYSH